MLFETPIAALRSRLQLVKKKEKMLKFLLVCMVKFSTSSFPVNGGMSAKNYHVRSIRNNEIF